MSRLVFLNYNNYFNRRVKTAYNFAPLYELAGSATGAITKTGVNFNPNDGVRTEIVVNWDQDYIPDYLLVCNEQTTVLSR